MPEHSRREDGGMRGKRGGEGGKGGGRRRKRVLSVAGAMTAR